jgi:hypothetical protein
MSISQYFALAGMVQPADINMNPEDAHAHVVTIDGSFYKGCIFGAACWLVKDFSRDCFLNTPRMSCSCSSAAIRMTPRT